MITVYAQDSLVLATMAGGGLFRSRDWGTTWSYLGPHRQFDHIERHDTLFAAAMDGIWYSADRALTWTQCPGFPPYAMATRLTCNDTYLFADAVDHIYRSDDFGIHWDVLDTGMPFDGHHLNGVFAVEHLFFVGLSEHKIYLSQDNGQHWMDISNGLDTLDRDVHDSQFGRSGNWVLSNKDGFLWRYDLSQATTLPEVQAPAVDRFELYQSYPNPFNPRTTLRYELAYSGHVVLRIFDILGREVAVLANRDQEHGVHEVVFEAAQLPSGVYFARIEAGRFVRSRRMILMK